ncbi:XLF family protein [Beauveria brongniartii RCEF 3172]|uniref:Non-homologous end-joining factor 1 n=1 Tax=Beauveria brongniartii RCEF 3172 TaxID=1081107 RepID=A0A162JFU1_9HYPO|nr:XLF family protein [Beauveria brongniartii RCEF 3172]
MAGAKTWRPLRLSGEGQLPPLLVAFETKASEYSIQVTDMAHVWTESMERKAICMRAWKEDTSIDPSDTPENMSKFLQTLRGALDETADGHDEATFTLSPGSSADSGKEGLKLVATCQLAGFEPLEWPFHLNKSSSIAITNEFAIPIVEDLYFRSRQVDMLIQTLAHKDAVIAKLSDKLEATGTGLEHVFTALSGRKKVTRETADGKIRGLAPFNEQKMNDELRNNADQPGDVTDLVQRVFGGNAGLPGMSMNFASSNLDGWWRSFSSITSLPHRTASTEHNQTGAPNSAEPSSPPDANDVTMGDDDDNDDEFQVQSTPSRLKPMSETGPSKDAHTSSKQSSPAKAVKEEHASSQEPTKAGRIGAICGKKSVPPPSPPKAASPPPPKTKTKDAMADDNETASETASDVDETASLPDEAASSPPADSSPPPPPPPPPSSSAPAKKSGLGRIGGKPRQPVHDAGTAEDDAASAAAKGDEEVGSTAPKRLGVIGKRVGAGTAPSADVTRDDARRGRATSRNASAAEAREEKQKETSQERADRKREELKRELEKKAAAGPAKKKRRF